jgi:hypothetical protein
MATFRRSVAQYARCRTSRDDAGRGREWILVRPLHDAALAVDPSVAMTAMKTMTERSAVQLWPFRTVSAMFMNK